MVAALMAASRRAQVELEASGCGHSGGRQCARRWGAGQPKEEEGSDMRAPLGGEREQEGGELCQGGELGQVGCAGEKGREGKRGFGLGWKRKRERDVCFFNTSKRYIFLTRQKGLFEIKTFNFLKKLILGVTAGSQWIVVARPLCHLQCPITYLSRPHWIQSAAREEGSFEVACRNTSVGQAEPMARALGARTP